MAYIKMYWRGYFKVSLKLFLCLHVGFNFKELIQDIAIKD